MAGRGRGSGVYINLNFSARRQSRIIFIPSYSRRIFVGGGRGRGRDVQYNRLDLQGDAFTDTRGDELYCTARDRRDHDFDEHYLEHLIPT